MADVVYHYTDSAGLLGILREKSLWCSNVLYLNDSSEWDYGVTMYSEMLKDAASDGQGIPGWPGMAEYILENLPTNGTLADRDDLANDAFAASFSRAADDLSQWRAYSRPGARYAIGFFVEKLREVERQTGMKLADVDYDAKRIKGDMLAMLKYRLDNPEGGLGLYASGDVHIRGARAARVGPLMRMSWEICTMVGLKGKHEKFANEREVRLWFPRVRTPDEKYGMLKFRPGDSFIVPYFDLNLQPFTGLIASVVVGPTQHRDLAALAVNRLLRTLRLGDEVAVEVTRVPYRDQAGPS